MLHLRLGIAWDERFLLGGAWAKAVGVDSLALIACLLFPR